MARQVVAGSVTRPLVAVVGAELTLLAVATFASWGSATGSTRELARYGTAGALVASIVAAAFQWRLARAHAPAGGRHAGTGSATEGAFDWAWSIDLTGRVLSSDAGI